MANAKTRFADNQAYLARVSAQTGMSFNVKSPATADRLVRSFRAQEAKGVPLSRQAARGHRVTPEHGPRGARPRLAAPVISYGPPPKSKYVSRTQPLVHRRPRVQRKVPFDRGVVYTVRTEAEVWAILDEWKPLDRAIFTGFDCSTGKWSAIFGNETGGKGKHDFHKPQAGMTIGHIRELVEQEEVSLEDFMVLWSQDEYRGDSLTHVCLFQIHVYPRETQQMQQIARKVQRLKR